MSLATITRKPTLPRMRLIQMLNNETKAFLKQSPYLEVVQRGELSLENWRDFLIQRCLAGGLIETLLTAGIAAAAKADDAELQEVFQRNLDDEMGVDESGQVDPNKAHAHWRRDFYSALGVEDAQFAATKPLASTLRYKTFVEKLAKQKDLFAIAGALLALERTIPPEFERIRDGRDKTFPQIFVDQEGDSTVIKNQKARARQYIDDHILHDANAHYPELLAALEKHTGNRKAMRGIQRGLGLLKRKVGMYKELEKLRRRK